LGSVSRTGLDSTTNDTDQLAPGVENGVVGAAALKLPFD